MLAVLVTACVCMNGGFVYNVPLRTTDAEGLLEMRETDRDLVEETNR